MIRARETGEGCALELGQSDAAAYMDWYRIESWKAYERPADVVTGNKSDDYERRAPGTAGMKEGVRYQIYESSDGHVLFMASEQAFWKNFCEAVGRPDLFERWPGSKYADHARGNRELQRELRDIFKTKTQRRVDRASATRRTSRSRRATRRRRSPTTRSSRTASRGTRTSEHGADMLPFPVRFLGETLPEPSKAPTVGEHSDEVLAKVLGYDAERIAKLQGERRARRRVRAASAISAAAPTIRFASRRPIPFALSDAGAC